MRTLAATFLPALLASCASAQSARMAALEQRLAALEQRPATVGVLNTIDAHRAPVMADNATAGLFGGDSYGGVGYGGTRPVNLDEFEDIQQRVRQIEDKTFKLSARVDELEAAEDAVGMGGPIAALFPTGTRTGSTTTGPEYAVPATSPLALGAVDAPVTWVVGIEVTEPYTRRLMPHVLALSQEYGAKLRVVFKHQLVHPTYAVPAAAAWCAAARQGLGDVALNDLVSTYDKSQAGNEPRKRLSAIRGQMGKLGLNLKRFDKDVAGACRTEIQRDLALFHGLGASGTPISFINGVYLGGAQPKEKFAAAIDEALAKATAELGGKSAAGYYGKIVKRGKTAP